MNIVNRNIRKNTVCLAKETWNFTSWIQLDNLELIQI